MSYITQSQVPQGEDLNPAEPGNTPLERAKEIKQQQRQNLDAVQPHADVSPDVPGAGPPSDRRHHPQRQMYGGPEARD